MGLERACELAIKGTTLVSSVTSKGTWRATRLARRANQTLYSCPSANEMCSRDKEGGTRLIMQLVVYYCIALNCPFVVFRLDRVI